MFVSRVAYFWYTPRKFGTQAIKRIVLKRPLRNEGKSCQPEGVIVVCSTYDVLVERSGVQPRNERLDGKECGQNTCKHSDKSENDRDTRRHPSCFVKVLLQRGAIGTGVAVPKLLDPESTVSSPPDRDLAFDNLPVLHESGGP